MAVLDSSIVNVAIPHIQTQFGASNDDVQWVVTAYTLSMGIVVPVSGWLGDRFGLRTIYNLALVLFIIGSALCGVAWGMGILIAFRIFQAVGGGLLPAISMAMVYRIAPRERIGMAMGLYGLGIVFAPAIGPTLGGYLVEYVDWRLIFYINVPIGILGLIAAIAVLPRFGTPGTQTASTRSASATICTSLFSLLLALSEGSSWGWSSYRVLGLSPSACPDARDLHRRRALRRAPDARRPPLPLLGVHQLDGARRDPDGRSLRRVLLRAAVHPGGPGDRRLPHRPHPAPLGDRHRGADADQRPALRPVRRSRWPASIGLLITAYGTYLLHNLGPDTTREPGGALDVASAVSGWGWR